MTAATGSGTVRVVNHRLVPAAGTYDLDPAHTFVEFSAQHLVIGHVRGRFSEVSGRIVVAEDVLDSSVEVSIAARSIDTHVLERDTDLRSPRFFDVDRFARISFAGTQIVEYPDARWGVRGDLRVRAIRCPVELSTRFTGATEADGQVRIGFVAHAAVSRREFGLVQDLVQETGSLSAGRDVRLQIAAEAVRV
ncbi:YceI family protein [Catenulispora sp. NF23]|uniref:YceI family protein n=1 Tax=Catenulispora pinistramenti TaxID=2705254 RepID=A0ABS5KQJ4_9ACTN|nr:YceI family protein [Catenulispora pinistramenti]MBS2531736.1 YceI family protein [Catenulispora pinistramenti]MBS2548301.1 YceI family protein [Catenulispora pinistramenti]